MADSSFVAVHIVEAEGDEWVEVAVEDMGDIAYIVLRDESTGEGVGTWLHAESAGTTAAAILNAAQWIRSHEKSAVD